MQKWRGIDAAAALELLFGAAGAEGIAGDLDAGWSGGGGGFGGMFRLGRGQEGIWECPLLVGKSGAVEDSESGFEADGGGGFGILENLSNCVERKGGEVAHLVAQGFGIFLSRSVELCRKGFRIQPVMDSGAVYAGGAGGGGDGRARSKGVENLDLDRRQS
jgi:hypothetical protein